MKKLFLSLAFLFSVLVLNAQTRIDFDYTKVFNINSMWVDFNQDNIADEGEVYEFGTKGRCELYINHKDFDTSGNLMLFKLTLQGGDKKEVTKFSFLMSIPIILLSMIMEIYEIFTGSVSLDFPPFAIVISFLVAFISGIFAIKFMMKLTEKCFKWFSIYLLLLGITTFFVI